MKWTRILWLMGLMVSVVSLEAQTISGIIVDNKGIPLPFATIQITQSDLGVVSNQEGYYTLNLDKGEYRLRYQYVGYKNLDTLIRVENSKTINIRLNPEALTLPTVVIDGSNEDPAYTIMRRAIAKAPYHANQIETYQARVYIKGSGRLLKTPFLFRNRIKKELAKEGIDSTVAFTQESVSRLYYKRPGQYKDTVISVRASGQDNNTSPMSFVYSSFYEPKVAGSVSPLAPNAFQIYTFEYMGYLEDHGKVINKIKVKPRGRGDQVFEGMLYITDQLWNLHSLDLTTSLWGIQFSIKQIFAPVQDDIWMPIDQIYDVTGDVFGFGFMYKYLAHLSEYKISINPDISVPLVVLDDKIDKQEAIKANEKINKAPNPLGISGLDAGQELSAKQLRKMMKQYEKNELDSLPRADTMTINLVESSQVVDSMAHRRDSLYWSEIRPVALTPYEIKGYSRLDSMTLEEEKKEAEEADDSTTVNFSIGSDGTKMNVNKTNKGFKLQHLVFGSRYNLDKRHYLSVIPLLGSLNFNTVDGYHASLGLESGNKRTKDQFMVWKIRPEIRYAVSREAINYRLTTTLQKTAVKGRPEIHPWILQLEGGKMVDSYNPFLTEDSYLNTIYSLLFRKNYLKLFEKKYALARYENIFSKAITFQTSLEWADRTHLSNTTSFSLFSRKKSYTSNFPPTDEALDVSFIPHQALVSNIAVKLTPFQRYIAKNGAKTLDNAHSPIITLGYKRGWKYETETFDHFYLTWKHHLSIGAGDDYDYAIQAGSFGKSSNPYFPDFAHFAGNRYVFSPMDPIKYFRLLDYYQYSTDRNYVSLLSNYQFRRFLFTSSPWVRKKGIRENIMISGLKTSTSDYYTEFGYSINYIFRFLRFEAVTSWENMKYKEFGFRFGVATGFENLFKF